MGFTIPNLETNIETERLCLRAYRVEDASWYHAMSLRNREHLRQFEAGNAAMSIQAETDAERVLAEFGVDWLAGRAFFLGAFERDTGEFVAQIYLGVHNRDLPEFEVGFFVDVGHEGRGYVSEAVRAVLAWLFRDLGAHRVRLECDDTNEGSARVAERCGFVREGHIRENHLWTDGAMTGTLHYGLLRTEFAIDAGT
jgi:RimJ/RimL family protein N-acetyltransferase